MRHSQSEFKEGVRVSVNLGSIRRNGTLIDDGQLILWDDGESVTPTDCFSDIRILSPLEQLGEEA